MALLVLVSTVSWTVDKHLCMGRVMDISFFADAESCGMEKAAALMEKKMENHCCGDETFTILGQDDLKLSWDDLEIEQQYFIVALSEYYKQLFEPINKEVIPDEHYPPPILIKDIQLFDQVFLI